MALEICFFAISHDTLSTFESLTIAHNNAACNTLFQIFSYYFSCDKKNYHKNIFSPLSLARFLYHYLWLA